MHHILLLGLVLLPGQQAAQVLVANALVGAVLAAEGDAAVTLIRELDR